MNASERACLKPGEVRERLGISKATYYRWLKAGKLRGVRVGGRWRFSDEAVDELLDAGGPAGAGVEEARATCLERLDADCRHELEVEGATPVEAAARAILLHALSRRATDVHLEPVADGLRVRERIDGVLVEVPPPLPPAAVAPVIRAVKELAEADPDQATAPQRGRLFIEYAGRKIDVRVFTFPTGLGDSVRLCLLDPAAVAEDLDGAGLPPSLVEGIRRSVRRKTGVFLVNGPTDTGKTTTHYLILKELARPGVKVMTVEDPVEIHLDGVLQANVTPEMDFRQAMLAMAASGVDVGMVSELRDGESIRLLFQMAYTGHMMLSSLHAPDAFTAVQRLLTVGEVERRTLVESLRGVLDQRLLPASCPDCRARRPAGEELAQRLSLPGKLRRRKLAANDGCERCGGSGVLGRRVVASLLEPGPDFCRAIESGVTAPEALRDAAPEGYRTLLAAAHEAIAALEVTPAAAAEALDL